MAYLIWVFVTGGKRNKFFLQENGKFNKKPSIAAVRDYFQTVATFSTIQTSCYFPLPPPPL
jgi:hypothetical protein